jgi:hypothetical protein
VVVPKPQLEQVAAMGVLQDRHKVAPALAPSVQVVVAATATALEVVEPRA